MLFIVEGDLLESDCTVLAHSCNCFSTMGSGLAETIAAKFPEAAEADRTFVPLIPEQRLGRCSRVFSRDRNKIIVNLYGQLKYGPKEEGPYTDPRALQTALTEMMIGLSKLKKTMPEFPIKIGIPYLMGCNRGGGKWQEVKQVVEYVSTMYGWDVYAYRLPSSKNKK